MFGLHVHFVVWFWNSFPEVQRVGLCVPYLSCACEVAALLPLHNWFLKQLPKQQKFPERRKLTN